MTLRKIKPEVLSVGSIHWDRKLFDELIPLPEGTSYNSYLIKGSEKTALIDTVDPEKVNDLIDNLVMSGIDKIDYIISNHAEQDHSGSIPDIAMLYPEAKVVTNEKCKKMLKDLLEVEDDRFHVVAEGDTLSLGDKTLEFVLTPWVHWPETMSTYLCEDKILFSCDFFGSHLAASDLYVKNAPLVLNSAKRYYAEIMMPFRNTIKKNMEKVGRLDIDMIAPSHGPVYDKPSLIIDAYKEWISDDVENTVVFPFLSMHESTKKMADHFIDELMDRGITVKPFNVTSADLGEMAMAMVDAATIVIGSPTVLVYAHPTVAYAALVASALKPKAKFVSIIGSYGWGSKMVEQLADIVGNLQAEVLEPVISKGVPEEGDFTALTQLAEKILAKHSEIGIV